jgi:hypothetical protein
LFKRRLQGKSASGRTSPAGSDVCAQRRLYRVPISYRDRGKHPCVQTVHQNEFLETLLSTRRTGSAPRAKQIHKPIWLWIRVATARTISRTTTAGQTSSAKPSEIARPSGSREDWPSNTSQPTPAASTTNTAQAADISERTDNRGSHLQRSTRLGRSDFLARR